MANAFIYSLFLVAIFHGCLLIMSFALWKNGYRILGRGLFYGYQLSARCYQ